MRTLAVVGARLNSSRLPKKHLLDLAGQPLIQRLFERLDAVPNLDISVLATTADDYNKPLLDWARQQGRPSYAFQGDVDDLVTRIARVVRKFDPEIVVYICGDCPLIDDRLITRFIDGLTQHPEWERIGVPRDAEGRESIHEGILAFSRQGWDKLVELSQSAEEREHVGLSATRNPQAFRVGSISEKSIYYQVQHRISVDTASDYRFMSAIYDRWYIEHPPQSIVSLPWVIEQLKVDSCLAAINAHVLQKSGWKNYGRIGILTVAGQRFGLGHLRRMVRIAEYFQEATGMGVTLHLLREDVLSADWLRFVNVEWYDSLESWLDALDLSNAQAFLVDVSVDDSNSFTKLRTRLQRFKGQVPLIGIDQLVDWSSDLTAVFVPCHFCAKPSAQNVRFGWDCYIVESPSNKHLIEADRNGVLVLTGGSDTYGCGKWLPSVLEKALARQTRVTWVKGPFAASPSLPDESSLRWQIVCSPENLGDLMRSHEIGVCVYGASLFESLFNRLPTLVLPHRRHVSDDEWETFRRAGVSAVADSEDQVEDILSTLVEGDSLRNELALRIDRLPRPSGQEILTSLILECLERYQAD